MANKKTYQKETLLLNLYCLLLERLAGTSENGFVRKSILPMGGYVKGNKTKRGERKFADIILYYKTQYSIAKYRS